MQFLYFTKSNGDIDSIPEDSLKKFKLTKTEAYKKFSGDSGVKRFSLQDPVDHPYWDGDKYISDPSKLKEDQIASSEVQRDKLLEDNVVEIREGIFIRTRLKDYPIFKELLADLKPLEVYHNFSQEYPRGNYQVFNVTREELELAFTQGKAQEILFRQQHALRVKEILGGN